MRWFVRPDSMTSGLVTSGLVTSGIVVTSTGDEGKDDEGGKAILTEECRIQTALSESDIRTAKPLETVLIEVGLHHQSSHPSSLSSSPPQATTSRLLYPLSSTS